MKEIYFSEDQLNNLSEIGQNLFSEENDPTSPSYKRVLIRPKLNYIKIILYVGLPVMIFGVYISILHVLKLLNISYILVGLLLLMAYVIVFLKKAVLSCIKIYQHLFSRYFVTITKLYNNKTGLRTDNNTANANKRFDKGV